MTDKMFKELVRGGLNGLVKKVGRKWIELTDRGAGLCQSEHGRRYFEEAAKGANLKVVWDTSGKHFYGRFYVE